MTREINRVHVYEPVPDRMSSFSAVSALIAVALVLTLCNASLRLPLQDVWTAITRPDPTDVQQVLFHFSFLPRVVVSISAGALLGVSGLLCQQILRNPLAEPTTLGVASGASLALTVATLWFPETISFWKEWIAFAGATAALAATFVLSQAGLMSSGSTILAGLIVAMFTGAMSSILVLLKQENLIGIFLWSSGSLTQDDWSGARFLLPRLVFALSASVLLLRPLNMLNLGRQAASLGLPILPTRVLGLAVAVFAAASVVSVAGLIGFIGFGAPNIARLAGARTLRQQLFFTPLWGAGVLWLADQSVLRLSSTVFDPPTGILTALIGAPAMLWFLPRLQFFPIGSTSRDVNFRQRLRRPVQALLVAFLAICTIAYFSVATGQSSSGWHWTASGPLQSLLPLRLPRMVAALSAGALLAGAGCLTQRLTGNPMAGPEVLGVTAGASLGVIGLAMTAPAIGWIDQLFGAAGGAGITLLLILAFSLRFSFSPERMLLVGITISTILGALVAAIMAAGDPRLGFLLTWLAGSTYRVTSTDAVWVSSLAIAGLFAVVFCARWLEILPLGPTTAHALGVSLSPARLTAILIATVMTAGATLIVGPLTFVGVFAPHIARSIGFHRFLPHVYGSALVGAFVMVVADWAGRNILFPFQVPAGLLSIFVCAPYFMYMLRRSA